MTKHRKLRNGGYHAVHKWLYKHHGKANKCDNLFCEKKSKVFHWAKKKECLYEHKIENFIKLCCKCHRKYDDTKERSLKGSETKKGKKLSSAHKKNISIACKGINKGNKNSAVDVIQTDMNGNVIKIWNCITDASRYLKISKSGISMCASGQLKTSGGFKWSYLRK